MRATMAVQSFGDLQHLEVTEFKLQLTSSCEETIFECSACEHEFGVNPLNDHYSADEAPPEDELRGNFRIRATYLLV